MKAIGYARAQLFSCRQNIYSVVVCAPDWKTAKEVFEIWLDDREVSDASRAVIRQSNQRIKSTKAVGDRPLLWAQVDVTV